MGKIKAYAVVGSGYGDCGKGLMTDFFCEKKNEDDKVLNIKSNGGSQAGHTVCRIDKTKPEYQHFVFNSLGSGTFVGADTLLASKFIVDAEAILKESNDLAMMYPGVQGTLYIHPLCRISLTIDKEINRLIEKCRSHKHGTCGKGIFETVNRSHEGFGLRLIDAIEHIVNNTEDKLRISIIELSTKYLNVRLQKLCETEQLDIADEDRDKVLNAVVKESQKDIDSIKKLLSKRWDVVIATLDEAIQAGKYNKLVFECSQGLELNWGDERNTPHVTASHTGLKNVYKELNGSKCIKDIESFEACYVTRSYKTKHGDGHFYELDDSVRTAFNLYDRTNIHNEFQGTLRFGRIDRERLAYLINKDYEEFLEKACLHDCNMTKSLAVTHIDQTDEAVLEQCNNMTYFVHFNAETVIGGDKTYYSFGEKASDVVEFN